MTNNLLMKKMSVFLCSIVVIILLSGTVYAKEQFTGNPILGFQDIPWGANEEIVKISMENKGMIYRDSNFSDGIKTLIFKGKYGGKDAVLALKLYNDEMWETAIVLPDIPTHKIIYEWNEFKRLLSDKYGKSNNDFYYFQSPYYEGDGYETQAIRLGKGNAATYWERPDGNGGNVILTCRVTENLNLRIGYQHVEMADKAIGAADKERSKGL